MAIERIGVVGAGLMGAEIALVFAQAGHSVLLADETQDRLDRAMKRLTDLVERGKSRGQFDAAAQARIFANLKPTLQLEDHADRDWCIEAVFEDEAVKAGILQRLDGICKPDCVISSNTSSISISVLAAHVGAVRRTRFLGTHFFSPVSRMKLVEVIPGFDTSEETVIAIQATCRTAGKEPIRVTDVVGFAVNRMLHAFWLEALRLVEEGVATPEDIDKGCRLGLGHPVGPFELMDAVTNGLTLQVQEIMHEAYGERFLPRPILKQMVRAGREGKKSGRGWYDYPARPK
ncbi:MAG: 3-hydroxyacyl-CoA dehydrogenase family protein [Alphaproteobacteria bacterium]|nr:3-hydroxyacyl-CoA dehydrogenase family protein [Alphaproteobacteria bacterium]